MTDDELSNQLLQEVHQYEQEQQDPLCRVLTRHIDALNTLSRAINALRAFLETQDHD